MRKNAIILIYILVSLMILTQGLTAQDATEGEAGGRGQNIQEIDESKLLLDGGETGGDAAGPGEEETGEGGEPVAGPVGNVTIWDFLRMILILGVIIGLIYIIFYFIKKRGSPKLQDNELFSIISTQAISNNRTLHLVQVGNQFFLVGSGEQSVNLISEIEDQETIDEIRLKLSNVKSGDKKSFKNIFSGLFGGGSVRLDGSVNSNNDFLRKQRDKLRRM